MRQEEEEEEEDHPVQPQPQPHHPLPRRQPLDAGAARIILTVMRPCILEETMFPQAVRSPHFLVGFVWASGGGAV